MIILIYYLSFYFFYFFFMQIASHCSQIIKKSQYVSGSVKQNYVPFISKKPRFQKQTSKDKEVIRQLISLAEQVSADRFPKIHKSKSKEKEQHCIFKSNLSRFKESAFQTPSPDHYNIQQKQPIKERSIKKKPLLLTPCRHQPSIPDNRNKFGYHLENQKLLILQKSRVDLQKQKLLMKKYQESLIIQKKYKLYTEPDTKRLSEKYMFKNMQRIIQEDPYFQKPEGSVKNKENNVENHRSVDKIRPKFSHLYEFKAIPQKYKEKMYRKGEELHSMKHKETRFQFFNSSQKRFKTQSIDYSQQGSAKVLRDYISKLITQKA